MDYYIIDGNNLMGKLSVLSKVQKKDKKLAREKTAFLIDNFFNEKRWKGSLHFDGFENDPIRCSNLKIIYSGKKEADDLIKDEIERSSSRGRLIVVSSDSNIKEFASVCGCRHLSSEDFGKKVTEKTPVDEEEKRMREIDNDEFKRLFGE